MNPKYRFIVTGEGFTVTIEGDEHNKGSIFAAIVDATLGAGESLSIQRQLV